jgi:hypothetical protein
MTPIHGLIRAKSLAIALLSSACLVAIPQIAQAINRCSPNNVYVTQNLGLVTSNPYTACPYGDPQVSPRCTTLTFSGPGSFSMLHAFNYEPECPNELYEVTFTGTYGYAGYVRPKYMVVGIYYAPPGAQSNVAYSNGFLSGTSQNISQSFGSSVSVSSSGSFGLDLFGIFQANSTQTFNYGWDQQWNSSTTISIVQQQSSGTVWNGPTSSALGVDHAYDTIAVWLNPEVNEVITGSNQVRTTAYYFDPRDPADIPDIVYLTVGQLEGSQAIPSNVEAALQRSWDPQLGALDSVDFQAILQADPFAYDPGFDPNTDASGRYTVPPAGSQAFSYQPEPQGQGQSCDTYSSSYNASDSRSSGGSDKYTVGFSIDGKLSGSFFASAFANLKVGTTFTYTNTWSNTVQSGSSQSANIRICRPLASDGYVGPINMEIWKDNVYGTFMFYPVD